MQQQLKQLHENDDSRMFRLFNYSDLQQSDCYSQESSYSQNDEEFLSEQDQDRKNQTNQFNTQSTRMNEGIKQDDTYLNQDDNQNNSTEKRKKILQKQRKQIFEDQTYKSNSSSFGNKSSHEQKEKDEISVFSNQSPRRQKEKSEFTNKNQKTKQDKVNQDKKLVLKKNQTCEIQLFHSDQSKRYQSLTSETQKVDSTLFDNTNLNEQKSKQLSQKCIPQNTEQTSKQELTSQDSITKQQILKSQFNARKSMIADNNGQNVTALADIVLKSIHKGFISEKHSILELNMDYFETMKNFKKFFVHNNFEWVIRAYNKIRRKKRDRTIKYPKRQHLIDIKTHHKINEAHQSKKRFGSVYQDQVNLSHLQYGIVSKKYQNKLPIRHEDMIKQLH